MRIKFMCLAIILFLQTISGLNECICVESTPHSPGCSSDSSGSALVNVTIINSVKPFIKKHQTILIENGIIVGVGNKTDIIVPANFKTVNLSGKYIIPGLIEGHSHITGRPEKCLTIALNKGITTIRDMGGDGAYLRELQEAVNSGELSGPDIFFSALMGGPELIMNDIRVQLSTPPVYKLGEAPWARLVTDTSNIERIISDAKDCGAKGIKIYYGLSAGFCKKLSDEAKRQNMKVWAHAAVIPASVEDVVNAGVEVISHAAFFLLKSDWDQKRDSPFAFDSTLIYSERVTRIIEEMKDNGTIIDPTLSISIWSINRLKNQKKSEELKDQLFALLERVYNEEIRISAGTDCPLPVEDDEPLMLHKEIEMLVRDVGLSPVEAIKTATITNAEILGIQDSYGSIEKGKVANLVVLKKNPVRDINNIERIYLVLKNGIAVN